MKLSSFRRTAAPSVAVLALGLSLTACAAGNEQPSSSDTTAAGGTTLSGTLNGAGSSAQEAAQGAWTAAFQTANTGATVNYDPVGSGGGREQFLAGGVSFAGSDSYMDDERARLVEEDLRRHRGVRRPGLRQPDRRGLQPRRRRATCSCPPRRSPASSPARSPSGTTRRSPPTTPAPTLPSTAITPVHRSDDSGTQDNFTQYLSAVAPDTWTSEPDGVWPLKSGEGANGTSGVIESVKNGAGSIGFADESQAGDLGVAKVKVGSEYVAPSAESAAKTVDVSPRVEGRPAGDIAIDVDRKTTESGAYPIVLVSYVIACPSYSDAKTADLVKGYLSYLVGTDGQAAAAKAAGSAPLSSSLSDEAAKQVDTIKAG